MNRQQLDLIPNPLLVPGRSRSLLEYLNARGLQMTLAELDAERRARGLSIASAPRAARRRVRVAASTQEGPQHE